MYVHELEEHERTSGKNTHIKTSTGMGMNMRDPGSGRLSRGGWWWMEASAELDGQHLIDDSTSSCCMPGP